MHFTEPGWHYITQCLKFLSDKTHRCHHYPLTSGQLRQKQFRCGLSRVPQRALEHSTVLNHDPTMTAQGCCCSVLCLNKWKWCCHFQLVEIYTYRHIFGFIFWGCALLLGLFLSDQSLFTGSRISISLAVPSTKIWGSLLNSRI